MQINTKILIKRIFFCTVASVIIFSLFGFWADFSALALTLQKYNYMSLPLLFILTLLNYILRFIKWHYYLKILGVLIKKTDSFLIFLSGFCFSLTPGRLGEFLKTYLIKKLSKKSIAEVFGVVVIERFVDFVSVVIICSYGIFLFKQNIKSLVFYIFVICLFLFFILNKRVFFFILKYFERFPIFGKISLKLKDAYLSTHNLMLPRPFFIGLILSIFAWLSEGVAFFLLFKIGLGIDVNFINSIFIYCFATIAGAVALTPGGLGITEGGMIFLTKHLLCVQKHIAVFSTILIRLVTLWFGVFLGILSFLVLLYVLKKRSTLG